MVLTAVAALLCAGSLAPTQAAADASVGKAAPEFSLPDSTGQDRSLAEFRGKYVVLEWFNPECPFVKKHYSSNNMQDLQSKYTEKGVQWLTINSSAPEKQGNISAEQAEAIREEWETHQTALLLDPEGKVGRLYDAKTTPHLFIVNPEGQLIYAGAIDDNPSADAADIEGATNYVAQALDQSMAGRPVAVSSSKPYGCSVKYD